MHREPVRYEGRKYTANGTGRACCSWRSWRFRKPAYLMSISAASFSASVSPALLPCPCASRCLLRHTARISQQSCNPATIMVCLP